MKLYNLLFKIFIISLLHHIFYVNIFQITMIVFSVKLLLDFAFRLKNLS
jgi:hypothetical protein